MSRIAPAPGARSYIERYRACARRIVAGVMSGTSLDGIDVAVCAIEGTGDTLRQTLLAFACVPYSDDIRARLLAASRGDLRLRETFELETQLAVAYADAVHATMSRAGIASIDAVGLHGQTVYHAPDAEPAGLTVQLSGGATLADRLGAIVVDDFRSADVASGGQGAPLVPYCDLALLRPVSHNRIALNLGGIANLTWLHRDANASNLIAFDTGPANVLVDAAMRLLFDHDYDADGAIAAVGVVHEQWLEHIIASHPYFARSSPKSTGREQFGEDYGRELVASGRARGLRPSDIVATLTALTARTVAQAARRVADGEVIDEVIVAGGGARNATMMRMLREYLAGTHVITTDELGIPGDAKEAICFAVLANEAICETPANVPSVTGARARVVCGALRMPPYL